MKIHISSLDYDGCLFTKTTLPKSMDDYITNNRLLLERIAHAYSEFDKKLILVGSNRQSTDMDASNGFRGTGSCFLAIDHISKHLGIEFDKFLLSDIYLGKNAGHTINTFLSVVNALNLQDKIFGLQEFMTLNDAKFLAEKGHSELVTVNGSVASKAFSEDKINLIYAQMHKIASEHPDDEIVFDFYDDRTDILQSLFGFFDKFPTLVPKNVTLNGFLYAAGTETEPFLCAECPGTGDIDTTYSQTVLKMGRIAQEQDPYASKSGRPYRMSEYVTPELLQPSAQMEVEARFQASQAEMRAKSIAFYKPAQQTTSSSIFSIQRAGDAVTVRVQ